MVCITIVPVAPMRAEAAHRSEMVSQLLFGECCEVLAESGDFFQVKGRYDGYEGWVQKVQLNEILPGSLDQSVVVDGMGKGWVMVNDVDLLLSPGSEFLYRVSGQNERNESGYIAGPYTLRYLRQPSEAPSHLQQQPETVIHWARQYLGASYLWGGKSLWGIDCSGLVQMSYKMAGFFMPRDAWQQAEGGDVVGFLEEAKPGDLAFFDNAEGRITHVGILLNPAQILHASGNVRIDPIDAFGIVHAETGKRTHNLRVIKRFF